MPQLRMLRWLLYPERLSMTLRFVHHWDRYGGAWVADLPDGSCYIVKRELDYGQWSAYFKADSATGLTGSQRLRVPVLHPGRKDAQDACRKHAALIPT